MTSATTVRSYALQLKALRITLTRYNKTHEFTTDSELFTTVFESRFTHRDRNAFADEAARNSWSDSLESIILWLEFRLKSLDRTSGTSTAKSSAPATGHRAAGTYFNAASAAHTGLQAIEEEDGEYLEVQFEQDVTPEEQIALLMAAPLLKRKYILPPCDWKGRKCTENHLMKNCPQFIAMSEETRFTHLKKAGRCSLCFKLDHTVSKCPHKGKRQCNKCQGDHHTMLHKPTPSSGTAFLTATTPSFSMYTTPINVALQEKGKYYTTNAIIDSGASTTLMSQQLATQLGVTGVRVPLQLTAINGECCTTAIQAKVATQNAQTHENMGFIDVKIVPSFPEITAVDWTKIKHNFAHLKDTMPPKPVNN